MNSGYESSNTIAITMPETENRPRSGSKGLLDVFRRRRKSSSNMVITNFVMHNGAAEKPTSSTNNVGKTRPRSHSVQINNPNLVAIPLAANCHEPLRVALAKKELVSRLSESPSNSSTPMSELLTNSLSRDDGLSLSPKKVGPNEFMDMYRNRRFSLDSDSRGALMKMRQRKGSVKSPTSPLALEEPQPTKNFGGSPEPNKKIFHLPKSSPDHTSPHRGTKPRRLSVFTPPPDRLEEGRFKQLGTGSRHRRFSEPQGPKMEALRRLSGAPLKAMFSENISDTMSNFPKFSTNMQAKSVPQANLGNCLGRHIPLEPAHYVIWKEGRKIERIMKLPCTEEEYLETAEDLGPNDNRVFVKFLKSHKCYELMPSSAKLVIFDKQLKVTSAFHALTYNGIRSAPVWDSDSNRCVGMLTATDFIHILRRFHHSKEDLNRVCGERISKWRDLLVEDLKPMVSVDSDTNLFEAVVQLHKSSIHRVLVADEATSEALYILTNRRIVHFVWYCFQVFGLPAPDFMQKSIKELDVGTYSDLASIDKSTRLIEVLNLLVERRLSVLPVLDADGHVVNIYGKFDIMNLVTNEAYLNLNRTIEEELINRRPGFEGLYICQKSDALGTVIDRLVRADVHRLVVVDDDKCLEGIVSLSDIVHFLVLQQNHDDVQAGEIEDETF